MAHSKLIAALVGPLLVAIVVSGLVRKWVTQAAAPIAEALASNATGLLIGGLVVLALGAFLSYKAYDPDTC